MTPADIRKLAAVHDSYLEAETAEVLRACADVVEMVYITLSVPLPAGLHEAMARLKELKP